MLLSEIVNLYVMKIMIMIGIYSKKGPANAWYIIFLHCKHRIYKKKNIRLLGIYKRRVILGLGRKVDVALKSITRQKVEAKNNDILHGASMRPRKGRCTRRVTSAACVAI